MSDDLFKLAKGVMKNAYAPYSKYHVGAAIRLKDGSTYVGCNVENASYGASVCAERVAIQNAIADQGGKIGISEVWVVTESEKPATPCGICRQVISEFALSDTKIHVSHVSGKEARTFKASELLPHAFSPEHLTR